MFEAVGDEVIKGVPNEGLDKVIGGVVALGVIVALRQDEFTTVAVDGHGGDVFEQSLVNRSEFLNVECSVIDPDGLSGPWVLVEPEGAEAVEEGIVGELAVLQDAEGLILEEISGKRGESDFGSGTTGFEEAEGGEQGEPEVVLAFVGEVAFFGEAAEPGDGVAAVEGFCAAGEAAGGKTRLRSSMTIRNSRR